MDIAVPVRPHTLLPPGRYPVGRGSEFSRLKGLQGVVYARNFGVLAPTEGAACENANYVFTKPWLGEGKGNKVVCPTLWAAFLSLCTLALGGNHAVLSY